MTEMSDIEWIKDGLNGLKDWLEKIDNKVEGIRETQTTMLTDAQRNWDSYKNLYQVFDYHKVTKCNNLICHEREDHKHKWTDIALFIGSIIGTLGGLYVLIHYMAKGI